MNSLMVYVLNITTGLIFSSQPWRGFDKLYVALSLYMACPPDADIMSSLLMNAEHGEMPRLAI